MTRNRPHRQVPSIWWIPLAVLIAGLLIVVIGDRALVGGMIMGAAFLLGALLRAVLPEDRAGGLAVRSRTWDILALLGLAIAVMAAFTLVDWAPRR